MLTGLGLWLCVHNHSATSRWRSGDTNGVQLQRAGSKLVRMSAPWGVGSKPLKGLATAFLHAFSRNSEE